jgi:succinate dehydrogenase / fumarate reductase flavoprotein subunit
MFNSKVPPGPIQEKWTQYKAQAKLINPSNRRKYKVIVVGTGLAGSSAAASLSELGFQVDVFTFHESPRRAHSVAAQGGINAAKAGGFRAIGVGNKHIAELADYYLNDLTEFNFSI